jgi:quercetin dioxygenase-like cupin family protein
MTFTNTNTIGPVDRSGNLYLNSVTRERAAVLLSAAESGGKLVRSELWTPPGARVAFPHTHPGQTERFEVLEGKLGVRKGKETFTASAGESITIPPGTVHDWWTEGDTPARVLVEVTPAGRFEEAIMTSWGLAAAGHTNADGRPSLLQLALLGKEWSDTLQPTSPPAWVQRLLSGTLGPIARLRGLRGAYPELEERILIGRLGEVLTVDGSTPVSAEAPSAQS